MATSFSQPLHLSHELNRATVLTGTELETGCALNQLNRLYYRPVAETCYVNFLCINWAFVGLL